MRPSDLKLFQDSVTEFCVIQKLYVKIITNRN
jgi:hypothetical protein